MNLLSPRYRTRQLLNKRWIAEFKKWPWSRWKAISSSGLTFSTGDGYGWLDCYCDTQQEAESRLSHVGVSDPELIEEGEELFPEETVINVANPYVTSPSGGMASTF